MTTTEQFHPIGFRTETGTFHGPLTRFGEMQGDEAKKWWQKRKFFYNPRPNGKGKISPITEPKDQYGERHSFTVVPPGCPTFDYDTANAIAAEIHGGELPILALIHYVDPDTLTKDWLRKAGCPDDAMSLAQQVEAPPQKKRNRYLENKAKEEQIMQEMLGNLKARNAAAAPAPAPAPAPAEASDEQDK